MNTVRTLPQQNTPISSTVMQLSLDIGPAATQTPQNNISAYTAEQGNIAANQITGVGNAVNTGITNWVAYDQNQQMLDALGSTSGNTDMMNYYNSL